uniref:Uncharacterized protein n=1 Tax=Strigamia maritima TaxID=126957 RepID=T1JN49_STRMM
MSEKLTEIVNVQMMVTHFQTFRNESFHAVVNHFTPKLISVSKVGITCRIYLAALHNTENALRDKQLQKMERCVTALPFQNTKNY